MALKSRSRFTILPLAMGVILSVLLYSALFAQDAHFHNAPTSSAQMKNPYAQQPDAAAAGSKLYAIHCASCHGTNGQGTGNVPALVQSSIQ